ncbi:MAG TPA: HEAT repeat domain-containing protein [Polyangia bacterium]|nr:HEAT repeat domain-containing protein [Polyangia bacterium]
MRARAECGAARTSRRLGIALAIAACALGCGRHRLAAVPPPAPARPLLGAVEVQVGAPPDEKAPPPHLDIAGLERALQERLLGTGLFASADAGAAPVARLQARVATEAVEVGATGEARARVVLRLDDGRGEAPAGVSFNLDGRGSQRYPIPPATRKGTLPAPNRDAIFMELVLRIAGDLIDGYVARRQIDQGPPAAVHAALRADGGELRDEAIRAVGERKLRDEVPRLLELLSDPEEPTRDAALGSLIALRDRRAVSELTRTRSLRDRREMHKIIEAIAILGGQEAEDYLSFVAATHDDDEIRTEAAAARVRLERRENDATAHGSE